MSLELYKIDRGSGGVPSAAKGAGLGILLGGPFGAVIGAAIGAATGVAYDFAFGSSGKIKILTKEDEIAKFRAPAGESLKNGNYVRHPKILHGHLLIPVERFSSFILREQVSNLIMYCRSAGQLTKLDLLIRDARGGSLSLSGLVEGLPIAAKAAKTEFHDARISLRYDAAQSPAPPETLVWIENFPQVKAAILGSGVRRVAIAEDFDGRFDLEVSTAKDFGLSGSLFGVHTFELEASFVS